MECGTRYYSAKVLKAIDETIRKGRKPKRKLSVPVYPLL